MTDLNDLVDRLALETGQSFEDVYGFLVWATEEVLPSLDNVWTAQFDPGTAHRILQRARSYHLLDRHT